MKSKLVILSLMLAGASVATAQTKEKFVSEKAGDNIFVSVTGGVSMVNLEMLLLILLCLSVNGSLRFGVSVPKVVCGRLTSTPTGRREHTLMVRW